MEELCWLFLINTIFYLRAQARTQTGGCRAAAPPPPPTDRNLKKGTNFVDTIISMGLRDLHLNQK
jgi:hypothetical protein